MVCELLSTCKVLEVARPGTKCVLVYQPIPPLMVDVLVQH